MNVQRTALFASLFGAAMLATPGLHAQNVGSVMPHLVDAGGWETTFFINNEGNIAETYSIDFNDINGAPLSLPLANGNFTTGVTGTVAANGLAIVQTFGAFTGDIAQGWAFIDAGPDVTGFAVFTNTISNDIVYEATVPFATALLTRLFVPFDNTSGFATGVALVNDSASSVTLQVLHYDESGILLGTEPSIVLGPDSHTAFNAISQFPDTAGRFGTLVITAPSAV